MHGTAATGMEQRAAGTFLLASHVSGASGLTSAQSPPPRRGCIVLPPSFTPPDDLMSRCRSRSSRASTPSRQPGGPPWPPTPRPPRPRPLLHPSPPPPPPAPRTTARPSSSRGARTTPTRPGPGQRSPRPQQSGQSLRGCRRAGAYPCIATLCRQRPGRVAPRMRSCRHVGVGVPVLGDGD